MPRKYRPGLTLTDTPLWLLPIPFHSSTSPYNYSVHPYLASPPPPPHPTYTPSLSFTYPPYLALLLTPRKIKTSCVKSTLHSFPLPTTAPSTFHSCTLLYTLFLLLYILFIHSPLRCTPFPYLELLFLPFTPAFYIIPLSLPLHTFPLPWVPLSCPCCYVLAVLLSVPILAKSENTETKICASTLVSRIHIHIYIHICIGCAQVQRRVDWEPFHFVRTFLWQKVPGPIPGGLPPSPKY